MILGHRNVDGKAETPGGLPLPLTGKPLTKTPVVVKREGVELRMYPEYFIPGNEDLGSSEMRLTCIGSGDAIVRRAQAATGWLVGGGETTGLKITGLACNLEFPEDGSVSCEPAKE